MEQKSGPTGPTGFETAGAGEITRDTDPLGGVGSVERVESALIWKMGKDGEEEKPEDSLFFPIKVRIREFPGVISRLWCLRVWSPSRVINIANVS